MEERGKEHRGHANADRRKDTRHRRSGARIEIYHGAGETTGNGITPAESRRDIRRSKAQEFFVELIGLHN